MPPPRLSTTIALIAIAGCVIYFMIGFSVNRNSDVSLRRAVAEVKNGEPERARNALKWLLWYQPDNSTALYVTGLSFLKQKNIPAAITFLERVAVNSTVYADASINLAAGLMADRQWERARNVLQKFLSHRQGSLTARRMLSGMLLTELRRREAIQVLTDCLRLPSYDRFSLSDRLTLLLDLLIAEYSPPQATTCQSTLEEINQIRPGQPTVRLALGQCYWATNRIDDAEVLLQEAIREQPLDLRTRLICCGFFLDQSDADAAEKALRADTEQLVSVKQRVVEPPETDDRFRERQCRIAELRGDYETALQQIEDALRIQPHNREYEARRARLLQRLQRADEAREAYKRSHSLGKSELELWHLSQSLGGQLPTTTDCRRVAELYELLGKTLQAAAWRHLAEQTERHSTQQPAA
ncbi:MAG: tetratricopeptide repeat protein [Fuerstiella sp.]|nr:tetratricopeptide repeat protein [Fuerstiella sp.]